MPVHIPVLIHYKLQMDLLTNTFVTEEENTVDHQVVVIEIYYFIRIA